MLPATNNNQRGHPAVQPRRGAIPSVQKAKTEQVYKSISVRKVEAPKPSAAKQTANVVKAPQRKVSGAGPIPQGQPVKGLSLKMPKKGKGDIGEQIDKRLQKRSPWYTSILDPKGGADCKIPDETGVETGTTQLCERLTFTSGDNGTGGLRICTPYINAVPNTGGVPGQNVQVLSEAASDSSISWGSYNTSGGTFGPGWGAPFDGYTDIQAITNAHRVVSCALYVEPEPSLDSNKGEFTLFVSPFSAANPPIYNSYMNKYKATTIPVNSNKPGLVRWYPFSRQDWNFKSFVRTDGTAIASDDYDEETVPPWELGVICSGCAPNIVFRVTAVVNYEFIPKFNTLNVLGVSPSPTDQQETDLVEGWVQQMPVGTITTVKKASESPSSVSPSHDDDQTGFGMFFNVLTELAPLALGLLL